MRDEMRDKGMNNGLQKDVSTAPNGPVGQS
jgi:hypothetical protein